MIVRVRFHVTYYISIRDSAPFIFIRAFFSMLSLLEGQSISLVQKSQITAGQTNNGAESRYSTRITKRQIRLGEPFVTTMRSTAYARIILGARKCRFGFVFSARTDPVGREASNKSYRHGLAISRAFLHPPPPTPSIGSVCSSPYRRIS